MKFSCNREELTRNLSVAQRAADPKSNIVVLGNVLFDLADNKLELTGFDHRIGIRTSLECSVETPGKITVPCMLLIEMLNVMSGETVFFELEGYKMNIECEKSTYSLQCMSSDDFPPFPEVADGKDFDMGVDTFDSGVRQTVFATNPDDPRAFMGGVYVKVEGGTIHFVGTDGHRLAFRNVDLKNDKVPEFEIVIPTRTLLELLRILPDVDGDKVNISLGERTISFSAGRIFIVSRLVDAKYPKFDKVIPDQHDGSCRVEKQKMLGAVRGAAIMARAKENKDLIEMSITDESIRFYSNTQDIGSANEEINVVKKGKDIRVAFNSRYIIDFLNVVDDDEILIEYGDEMKPALFHVDDPGYKYVLMPIKI